MSSPENHHSTVTLYVVSGGGRACTALHLLKTAFTNVKDCP